MLLNFWIIALLGTLTLIVEPLLAQDNVQIDEKGFHRLVNMRRRMFAKRYLVPEMYELVWDEKLVEMAKSQVGDVSPTENWRFYRLKPGYTEASWDLRLGFVDFREMSQAAKKEFVEKREGNGFVGYFEFYLPAQKRIGCAPRVVEGKAQVLCLLGPQGKFDSFWFSEGEEGSQCPDGYFNNDGLCSVGSPKAEAKLVSESSTNFNLPIILLHVMITLIYLYY